MILSDFHSEVSEAVGRGSIHDTLIVTYTRRAARWIERNYTLEYMKKFKDDLTISEDDRDILLTSFVSSNATLKRVLFWRIADDTDSDGLPEYYYIEEVDPQDHAGLVEARPKTFWRNGSTELMLGQNPGEDYTSHIRWDEYTVWPTDTAEEPWLLANADDVMLGQTMLMLGPRLRLDPARAALWKQLRDEGLRTLLLAEDELRAGAVESSMRYGNGLV